MCCLLVLICLFFFQAEDGIRDGRVTGVQTCALPPPGLPPAGPREIASDRPATDGPKRTQSRDRGMKSQSCCPVGGRPGLRASKPGQGRKVPRISSFEPGGVLKPAKVRRDSQGSPPKT